MTAEILQFKEAKIKKDIRPVVTEELLNNIFNEVSSDTLSEWSLAAKNNKLNDYFTSKIPPLARGARGIDYINDLNALSIVEQKLQLVINVSVIHFSKQPQWSVSFVTTMFDISKAYTIPLMHTEYLARALNILIYLSFLKTTKSLNY
jgi:hypothetical protein